MKDIQTYIEENRDRFLEELFELIRIPSISALVADHTVPEERGIATGIFHALLTAGVAIGAPIVGCLGETTGVELGLALSASILVLALVVALRALKRT